MACTIELHGQITRQKLNFTVTLFSLSLSLYSYFSFFLSFFFSNFKVCLEEENQEKIQEMVRIYKKGPISLDPNFVTLRCKIGSGFFGEVYLATIPLRNSNSTNESTTTNATSTVASSSTSSTASLSNFKGSELNSNSSSNLTCSNVSPNNNTSSNSNSKSTVNSTNTGTTCNYIQVAVKLLKDSSLFNSRVREWILNLSIK